MDSDGLRLRLRRAPTRSIDANPEQNPQSSLNQTEPEMPFLASEDGKKKKKRKRNLLALKPRKASSASAEALESPFRTCGATETGVVTNWR